MSNSFYYFFSAVPQVLGGILALFGVFVIFKIQSLKLQLIGIGQSIINYVENYLDLEISLSVSKEFHNAPVFGFIINEIKMSISRNDINGLKSGIEKLDENIFGRYKNKYMEVNESLISLVKSTINWSVFTVVIIVICLTTLPFGDLMIEHIYILYTLVNAVIICIIICFYSLLSILKKALNDSEAASSPN